MGFARRLEARPRSGVERFGDPGGPDWRALSSTAGVHLNDARSRSAERKRQDGPHGRQSADAAAGRNHFSAGSLGVRDDAAGAMETEQPHGQAQDQGAEATGLTWRWV